MRDMMSARLSEVWLAIVLGWVGFAVMHYMTEPEMAVMAGLLLGVGLMLGLRRTRGIAGIMAVLEPIGVVLPLLALRHMLGALGVAVPEFGALSLVLVLLAYVGFLAASMGALPGEVYRLGYAPVPVAVMVLAACGYGYVSGQVIIALIAVIGQGLWVLRWGSSNWFDHVLHVVLVPVIAVDLILRLF